MIHHFGVLQRFGTNAVDDGKIHLLFRPETACSGQDLRREDANEKPVAQHDGLIVASVTKRTHTLFTLAVLPLAASLAMAQPQPMASGDGIWLRNAFYGEAQTFDACGGHQPGNGQYHHHAVPNCLREQLNDNVERIRATRNGPVFREKAAPHTHSPILGWAFDGNPIYGPYGYSNPSDATSDIRRMRSGFRLRQISERTSLPDWTAPLHPNTPRQLSAAQSGPPISAEFPLGRYLEDFEWSASQGDLDVYNGRFTVTPEFPQGTYAYYVTIEADGTPAFPYILGAQFYGAATGGVARNVPANAQDNPAASVPLLTSWLSNTTSQKATVSSAFNPSAGGSATWPTDVPTGARTSGGVAAPADSDIQRLRANDTSVYVNANGLPSYTIGPWFDALQAGGVFGNFPSVQAVQMQFPRTPASASTRTNTALGAQGLWVNGVAVFNALDGASYSNARRTDAGGGIVALAARHLSAASLEAGPLAPGSLVSAYPLFGLEFPQPESATITIRDSANGTHTATILYASSTQMDYRLPSTVAAGYASVSITSNGVTLAGNINIRETYPNLFAVTQAVDSSAATLTIYGSGLGAATSATATIAGNAVEVVSAGPSADNPGVDEYVLSLPRSLAGSGVVPIVITAAGRSSNAIWVEFQ